MPTETCKHCGLQFDYDTKDTRPYLYHECPDGSMMFNDNPNLVKTRKPWNPATSYKKKKKTHWQDWGY